MNASIKLNDIAPSVRNSPFREDAFGTEIRSVFFSSNVALFLELPVFGLCVVLFQNNANACFLLKISFARTWLYTLAGREVQIRQRPSACDWPDSKTRFFRVCVCVCARDHTSPQIIYRLAKVHLFFSLRDFVYYIIKGSLNIGVR